MHWMFRNQSLYYMYARMPRDISFSSHISDDDVTSVYCTKIILNLTDYNPTFIHLHINWAETNPIRRPHPTPGAHLWSRRIRDNWWRILGEISLERSVCVARRVHRVLSPLLDNAFHALSTLRFAARGWQVDEDAGAGFRTDVRDVLEVERARDETGGSRDHL